MKRQFAKALRDGLAVDSVFVIRAKEVRVARTGDAYVAWEFGDSTGCVPGVQFRPDAVARDVPVGCVARVRGVTTSFRGVMRVSVESLRPTDEYALEDLLPAATRDRRATYRAFRELLELVRGQGLSAVLRAVFEDRAFVRRFVSCPASQAYHRPYVGGLLEHTVAVAELARCLGRMYEESDHDLLLAAALLHDIGKVDELDWGKGVSYTDAGRLLGHVVLGERRLTQAIVRCELDEATAVALSHVVLSHHGELEWGAPKRPSTLEALLLHHADNLDAKATGFLEAANGAIRAEERWTDAKNLFRRPLYAPRPVEADRWHEPEEDDQWVRQYA